MLNFRKLKQDFSPGILKDGKALYDKQMVISTKIINLKPDLVRFSCRVMGGFDNCYESELEIDRNESVIVESDCDCPYKYDCQHLAAVLFHLEQHYHQLVIAYSKETDLEKATHVDDQEKANLIKTFEEAEFKENVRQDKQFQKELLEEYIHASQILGQSSFFHPEEEFVQDKAELIVIFMPLQSKLVDVSQVDLQLALRLPFRSKPLNIAQVKNFLDAVSHNEAIYIGSKRYFFSISSFDEASAQILKLIIDFARLPDPKSDKQRFVQMDLEAFGILLAVSYSFAENRLLAAPLNDRDADIFLPCLYFGSIEEPLRVSLIPLKLRFELNYLQVPSSKLILKPQIVLKNEATISCEEALLFECASPGMIYQNIYYRFQPNIKRKHLRNLSAIRDMTIPEPLFGTFVENALSELVRFAEVTNKEIIERFVTLPFVEQVGAECDIHYSNGELEASLYFVYGHVKVPASNALLTAEHISTFVTPEGILARNLTEEQKIINHLFQDFVYDPIQGVFSAKNEKKIVEFMTETIPAHQHRIKFNCPENLLDQFIYDDSTFKLSLRESSRIDIYEVEVKVEGHLQGVTVDLLWDCLAAKRAFIELTAKKEAKRKGKNQSVQPAHKILVLDLEKLAPVVQILDEMGINSLSNHVEMRPLWSLASLDLQEFAGLPIHCEMTPKLQEIQKQMLGSVPYQMREIPSVIQASLRNYQMEGIHWLDRLRSMHLNGILADDMGLGKTLQAIIILTQYHQESPGKCSIVVCPTSLVYNWKEEFAKFNPQLRVLAVDGNPNQRKKLLSEIHYLRCDHHFLHFVAERYGIL